MEESDYPPLDAEGDFIDDIPEPPAPYTPTSIPHIHCIRQSQPALPEAVSSCSGSAHLSLHSVPRERSFYDQHAMYSKQMQAMGMGAPFMLGGAECETEDPSEDVAAEAQHWGFGGPHTTTAYFTVGQAAPSPSASAGHSSHLDRECSSRPATLYNTQGQTNDFGSGSAASGMLNYSLYSF